MFLTPFLAAIAGLFFYKILLKIFDSKIAFISTLLFYFNPAWWYYGDFAMLPNICFLSFLIIGLYFLLHLDKEQRKNNICNAILGSFFISLALIVRTNEFIWILGILVALAISYHKKLKWQYLGIFALGCFMVFVPIFHYNQITYGNYLSFGYLRLEAGDNLAAQLPTEFKTYGSELLNFIKFVVLPFGFDPKTILVNFYHYYISLFWWLFLAACMGWVVFLKKYQRKNQAVYFLLSFCVSLYLLAYYGSWVFADPLTIQLNKIGISYVRYFLPIYLLSLPFIAIFYNFVINLFYNKKIKIILTIFFALITVGFGINVIYLGGQDNLIKVSQYINQYEQINKKVLSLTEENAVIISQRGDKIFFPQRKVIGRWTGADYGYWLNLLYAGVPLYYYAYESDDYLYQLNEILFSYDMELANVEVITAQEKLYKIIMSYQSEEYD